MKAISSTTMTRMKRSPVLLGLQRIHRRSGGKDLDDLDDEEWDLIYDLKKPEQITIADDTHAYQTFGPYLFTAPQEDILEGKGFSGNDLHIHDSYFSQNFMPSLGHLD